MRSRLRAFTLVELLVVIGIIALLVSILLPALSKAREQATIVACAAQMRDIGNAVQMYTMANRGYFPGPCWGQVRAGYYNNSYQLTGYLWKYLKLPEPRSEHTSSNPLIMNVSFCPGYRAKNPGMHASAELWTYSLVAWDPYVWTGYASNTGSSQDYYPLRSQQVGITKGRIPPMKIDQVFKAAEMPFLMDIDQGEVMFEEGSYLGDNNGTYMSWVPNHGGKAETRRGIQVVPNSGGASSISPWYRIINPRAATNPPRNTLFVDGHVVTLRRSGPVIPPDRRKYSPPTFAGPYFN